MASNLANSLSKPPARRVSNYIFYQGGNEQAFDEYGLTHMVMQWGQYVDHDLTDTRESGLRADIKCDANDHDFPGQIMEFTRAAGVGNDDGSNVNAKTHFLDGSNIYGSDSSTLLELRDVTTSTGLNRFLLKMTKEYDNQALTRRQLLPIRINTYNEE
ncbi:hypothetical protein SARC_01283 [Sphaeroforma arctica JP610]|uniref:Peroxidase n=1 Tax=Sphaeroforma arctica JP610 TaxID=667725 RepID=A0A0L0GC52_9EUKA|nr:hypothetical protein SARC_01283 [Sphaeroforma arctica JP610]KNC86560.1 hypothetical protein SARC_01283 [Sphaeroforma arctica JP610]|eukprot:XP_014160462.1 hypothetical protein SARC_01283 [Sphaeroforma arctica JP610]